MKNFLFVGCIVAFTACGEQPKSETTIIKIEPEEVALATTIESLGEQLFFDKKLSLDNSISCATCHIPEHAFSDTTTLSIGVHGLPGKRNTPSAMNMASRSVFFYDGRATTLEDQAVFPMEDHLEMAIPIDSVIVRLQQDEQYVQLFMEVFNAAIDKENLTRAIAAYERTLETSNTPFDRYMNDQDDLTESEKRGHALFLGQKAKCFDCHFGPDFTGDEFRNIGLYDEVKYTDKGRFNETQDESDLGKFKVPGLRNIAVTAPYMHDGSFKTLREVLDYYNNPYEFVAHPINMDSIMIEPLGLSDQDLVDLEAFLLTLTDDQFTKK